MITDWLLHALIDPVVALIAGGLDLLPDMTGFDWVVTGAGTLNQMVPLTYAVGLFGTLLVIVAAVFGVRGVRALISHFTGGGGVS